MDADVIVVGAGLAGLVAAHELASAGRSVVLLDQENEANLGGQAFWSFGGLFLVDSPEQRRLGIKDSLDLAWSDWQGTASWDRLTSADGGPGEDHWGRRWARAYVEWAAGVKRSWLAGHGVSFFPVVGWAERGDGTATGHGNSVPRFHIPWGTGTGVVKPFAEHTRRHIASGHTSRIALAIGSTSSSPRPVGSWGCVGRGWLRTRRPVGWPRTVTSSATSRCVRRPSS